MTNSVFFLSDGTGITVETLGHTLLTQFDNIQFRKIRHPHLDSPDKVEKVVREINEVAAIEKSPPLVFSTLVATELREIIHQSHGVLFDIFDIFIKPMEQNLGIASSKRVGHSHGIGTYETYKTRIDAVHFTMENDDGITTENYPDADIIIIGVSRSGKTPTCLYLALNYGIRAANYPLTVDDLDSEQLTNTLKNYKNKLYGLNINPNRLHQIRSERRPNSRYAELKQCQFEVRSVDALYKKEKIPHLDTSTMSIEEIATFILKESKLERRVNV